MNCIWTEAEKNFIRANAAILKDVEIAATLSRLTGRIVTLHAVRHARANLGIAKRRGRGYCEIVRKPRPDSTLGLSLHGETIPPLPS